MTTTQATGTARLENDGKTLVITTQARRGKRVVPLTVTYAVLDCRPDPRVAFPAFSLTKESGEVYHVAVDRWGPTCTCADQNYRRDRLGGFCKHIRACQAANLLPKGNR